MARRKKLETILRQRVLAGLHLGVLMPGDRLPGVRATAGELGADPRMILAGYRRLELEGIVEVRPRSGVYVAGTRETEGQMLPRMASWIAETLTEGLARGVPAAEFPERLRRCLSTVELRVVCFESTTDQIVELSSELARDYGVKVTGAEAKVLESADLPAELVDADLFVTTRFHARKVEIVARALGKPHIVVSLRRDLTEEVRRYAERGPLYFVGVDPRLEKRNRLLFERAPGSANVRTLIVGRDDLGEIPNGAPTYVMESAKSSLEDVPSAVQLVAALHVFSSDSAHELLSFIIRRNIEAIALQEAAGEGE